MWDAWVLVVVWCGVGVLSARLDSADVSLLMLEGEPGAASPRRITPKSVFVAPTFCSEGYRQDSRGRCVKVVRLNQAAQWEFFLKKLNSMYAPVSNPEEPPDRQQPQPPIGPPLRRPTPGGPLRLPIPIHPQTPPTPFLPPPPTTSLPLIIQESTTQEAPTTTTDPSFLSTTASTQTTTNSFPGEETSTTEMNASGEGEMEVEESEVFYEKEGLIGSGEGGGGMIESTTPTSLGGGLETTTSAYNNWGVGEGEEVVVVGEGVPLLTPLRFPYNREGERSRVRFPADTPHHHHHHHHQHRHPPLPPSWDVDPFNRRPLSYQRLSYHHNNNKRIHTLPHSSHLYLSK